MSEKRSTRQRAQGTTYLGACGPIATPNSDDEAHRVDVLAALRENQRLLRELAYAYRMPRHLARSPTSATGVPVISCPHDVAKLLGEEMSTLCQEQLRVVLLDTKNQVLGCELIYQGTIHGISIRAAEVLRPAVLLNAPAVIVVHNHPSGDPSPSDEDVRATEHLMAAGDTIDVHILDHVVLGTEGKYVSMQERCLLSVRCNVQAAA